MKLVVEMFTVVLAASWHAGLLIVLFLAIRPLVRNRIPAQVLYVGWIVVALRLLIPFGIPAVWSPYNLVKSIRLPAAEVGSVSAPVASARARGIAGFEFAAGNENGTSVLARRCALVWIVGATGLLAARVGVEWIFRRRLRRSSRPADERVQAMVRRCALELGVVPRLAAIMTNEVAAPALFGLGRSRLLFPVGFAGKLTDEELRLVVLHEMGHWRRRDLLAQTLLHYALILHWLNPLAWLAVWLARHDCEIACDEFVLRRCTPEASGKYGATLIRLLETVRPPVLSPVTLGIFEGKQSMKQRIRMVAVYRAATRFRTLAGSVLLAALVLVGATHESWAREIATAITRAVPGGWRKTCRFDSVYEVGVDRTQPHRQPASAYMKAITAKTESFCTMTQVCSAEAYRGKRVRFSSWVKTEQASRGAGLYLRINHGDIHGLQFDDMRDRLIGGTTGWTLCTIVLDVPVEADTLHYGFTVTGGGRVWFNDPRIEIVGLDVPSTNLESEHPSLCTNPDCLTRILVNSGPLPKAPVNIGFSAPAPL